MVDYKLVDVFTDGTDELAVLRVVNASNSCVRITFYVCVPFEGWQGSDLLDVSLSHAKRSDDFLPAETGGEGTAKVEILHNGMKPTKEPHASILPVACAGAGRELCQTLVMGAARYMDSFGAPHFVNMHALTKTRDGVFDVLVCGETNLGGSSTEKVLSYRDYLTQSRLERWSSARP